LPVNCSQGKSTAFPQGLPGKPGRKRESSIRSQTFMSGLSSDSQEKLSTLGATWHRLSQGLVANDKISKPSRQTADIYLEEEWQ
jgi:hypothetical protein